MRILVAVPGISYSVISRKLEPMGFVAQGRFSPSARNLDAFSDELKKFEPPSYMWGVNIPHWPMEATSTKGVAGPGRPQDELFYPRKLQRELSGLCGKYDKWRPYPAETLSGYAIDMASRFSKKRCKMFAEIARKQAASVLFYVEHSPASLAHLSMEEALVVAEAVIKAAIRVSCPDEPFVVFSPYGADGGDGFYASNGAGQMDVSDWDAVRRFLASGD